MNAPTLPPGFEDLNVPDMIRHVQQNMDMLVEDSPEQVLYIYRHLNTILEHGLTDLLGLTSQQLQAAHDYLEGF